MEFITPLGLIALVGIPILIIIYIIKPRYQEKKISSTYIWKLSLKYKKKKRPIQWLQKSLLFFIQLLIITFLALAIARPELLLQAKSKEKVIILDISASMNAEINGVTRFDRAINEIESLIKDVDEEDPMTIILANNNPEFLVNRETSTKYIEYVLRNIECSFEEADYEKSMELANEILEINQDAEIILYTDHDFSQNGYVTIRNMLSSEWNTGISNFEVKLEGGYYIFEATVENYNNSEAVELYLNVDNKKYTTIIELYFDGESKKEIVIDNLNISSFTSAKLSLQINGKSLNDSFEYDNEFMYYQNQNKKFKVQLVGNETNFINSALIATGVCNVYKKDIEDIEYEGYDIYVFDSFVPEFLPSDGAIWLFNCPEVPVGLNYTLEGEVEGNFNLQSTNIDTINYQNIMANTINLSNVQITKYQKISSLLDYEVMISCDGDPVLFTGKYEKAPLVVMALDLHYTELPVDINMPILINNLVHYSAHNLLDKYQFTVGENITMYPKLNAKSITINDEEVLIDEEENVSYLLATKPGRYEVKQYLPNEVEITNYFFVRMGENETNFNYLGGVLAADEYVSSSPTVHKSTDNVDILVYISALLLLLVVIEWGLSYHEQY